MRKAAVVGCVGLLLATIFAGTAAAQQATQIPGASPPIDFLSDTWVGTDALGRTLVTADQARAPRGDRYVGIFHLTTHGAKAGFEQPGKHRLRFPLGG